MVSGYQMMLIYLRFHSPLRFLEQAENALSHFSFSLLLLLYSFCSVISCLFIFIFYPSYFCSLPAFLFSFHFVSFPSLSITISITVSYLSNFLHHFAPLLFNSCYLPCFHLSIFHLSIPLSPTPPTKVSILPLSLSICCLLHPPLLKPCKAPNS